jgi:large subunit ribosomal protein L28
MSRVCVYSGKITGSGNKVSHSVRRTKRTFMVNLHYKKVTDPRDGMVYRLRLSTHAIRTMRKKGVVAFLQDFGL